jgi:hypothetical protein
MSLTRALAIAVVAGLAVLVAAFIPSPMRLLSAFDQPGEVLVAKPPPLVLQELPPVSAYADVAARPIFNEGRRPDPLTRPAASSAAPAADQGELSEYRLVGIVADSMTQRAIVERPGAPSLRLAPGDRLAGWRIDKIDATGVVASKDARSIRIAIPKAQTRTGTP